MRKPQYIIVVLLNDLCIDLSTQQLLQLTATDNGYVTGTDVIPKLESIYSIVHPTVSGNQNSKAPLSILQVGQRN